VTDVTSADLRCYTSATGASASTVNVAAGSSIEILSDGTIYHAGVRLGLFRNLTKSLHSLLFQVVNIYMAKAPSSGVTGWAGDGSVWFKVYQISAVTDGGTSITFPAQGSF